MKVHSRWSCFVIFFVHLSRLTWAALEARPSVSISVTEEDPTRLECKSEQWGTTPKITLRDMNGVDMTSEYDITEERDKGGILRVNSIIPIKQEFNVFSCLMRSTEPKPDWHSEVVLYYFSPGVSGWMLAFWSLFAVCVTVAALLVFKWQKMQEHSASYDPKVNFLRLCYLRKESEIINDPAVKLTTPKVIQSYSHEDLFKLTKYFKPNLVFILKFKISYILQTLVTRQILTSDEAKIVKAKQESEGTKGVQSFIDEMMSKDGMALVSLWEALNEEYERCPKQNLHEIIMEVTESGKKLLVEIQTNVHPPLLEPHIKDLHETHRLAVSESIRSLDDRSSFLGDSHMRAVDFETQYTELIVLKDGHWVKWEEFLNNKSPYAEVVEEWIEDRCVRIWDEQLFKTPGGINPSNTALVIGEAGIGKTTMVQKIMFDWARGSHYQRFAFVFLFKFRDFNFLDDGKEPRMSLNELIVSHYKYLGDGRLGEILQQPNSLLFILDGLNDYKHKLNLSHWPLCSDPNDDVSVSILFASLVRMTLLKGCSVLLTGTPTALHSLGYGVNLGAVILGFVPEKRLTYFKKMLGDENLGVQAMRYVEQNAVLYSMSFNPSYCWIICAVLKSHFTTPEKERDPTPKTVTELFVMFLHNILTSHRQDAEEQRTILIKLGKMAYYGVDKGIHIFSEKQEISTFGLKPYLSSPSLSAFLHKEGTLKHTTYTFICPKLQEFVAACSFYLDPLGDIEELLVRLNSCDNDQFNVLTRFLVGLARPSTSETLEGILGEFDKKTAVQILEWVKTKALDKPDHLRPEKENALQMQMCHWLYETQNEEFTKDVMRKELNFHIEDTLSALDCAVLDFVIRCRGECKSLHLDKSDLSPDCSRGLAPCFSVCRSVILYWCRLPSGCCADLSLALAAPHSQITSLSVHQNKLGDSGVHLLCEGLRSKNCKLERLILSGCNLTSGCCAALSSVLSCPHLPLKCLILTYNHSLGDSGMHLLCEGLMDKNCKLEILGLEYCELTSGCCAALSLALSAEHSRLTSLEIGGNDLGDSGAHLLCEGLKNKNCKLTSLSLKECHLTSGCCAALSSILSSSHSKLTYLNLANNKLEESGLHLLCEGIRSENCKLETLCVHSFDMSDSDYKPISSLKEELNRSGRGLFCY
ncbi:NACHT, LRR and PYD domains-containing protein 3-like isoform X2 [Polypterus senegalus]|uniref:NACHT, LRR and PYD domains-containing protein 3-like isoform X2 n=1 Tax=Polypterus senegalus TaxID=55291 RepID=UPI001964A665|nr:NACHT, LRR and PYD domains-containing protein 3-like isoform X2 [Polypterus senegalus]